MSVFKEGSMVSFPYTKRDGKRGLSISTRRGRVLVDDGGETVLINYRGKAHKVDRDVVRADGERTALTEALLGGDKGNG